MSYFIGSQGRVFHQQWLPHGDARAIAVVLHGYGEHSGLYERLARRLAADGVAVHGLDALGHGRSDGARGVIASWNYYVDDARILVALARAQHPDRPLVLIGHSGGALAAFLLAQRSPAIAEGLVVSGAPLLPLVWVGAELDFGEEETEPVDPTEWFSTDPEYVHALLHDPLTLHGGFRRESLLAVRATWPEVAEGVAGGRPDLPTLFVHGEEDPVVPVTQAWTVARQLPRATVRAFPGDLHDVLNEHDRDTVHDTVAAFVGSVLATGPSRLGEAA